MAHNCSTFSSFVSAVVVVGIWFGSPLGALLSLNAEDLLTSVEGWGRDS